MAERRGSGALATRLDLEHLQRKLFAFFGERARRGRQPFALGERLLERGQALARERDARFQIVVLADGGAHGSVGLVGRATELGGRGARRRALRLGKLAPRFGEQPLRRLVPHPEALCGSPQREERVARPTGERRFRLGTAREDGVQLGRVAGLRRALDRADPRPALLGLDLQPCAFSGGGLGGGCRVACRALELDRGARVERAGRLQLRPERGGQRRSRLAAQREALASAPQAVQSRRCLLARARRVGQLLLGALALGNERGNLLVERVALGRGRRAPPFRLGAPLREPRQVKRRDRGLNLSDLDAELLGALGGGRLQRKRTQPLLDLVLEIARTVDLDANPGELQLGAMAPALEAAEPGRLLDQLAALGRLRVEHRLDAALRDDRAQPSAETDIREELDEVDAADRCLVHEVLALAAAMQAPGKPRPRCRAGRATRRPSCRRADRPRRSRPASGRWSSRRRERRRASRPAVRPGSSSPSPRGSSRRRSTSRSRSGRRRRRRRARGGPRPGRRTT